VIVGEQDVDRLGAWAGACSAGEIVSRSSYRGAWVLR